MRDPHRALRTGTLDVTARVIFVGAGPGSADLITMRGAHSLARADVVLHDALIDPALREHAPRAEWIDVGKRGFAKATAQARINALLVQLALAHGTVVRLKGGDPSVFGRLEEELQALAEAGIACEVVPGVTAALAAAAATACPLTRRERGRSVAFTTAMSATGPLAPQQLAEPGATHRAAPAGEAAEAPRPADTEVFYMGGRQLARLAEGLMAAGRAAHTPVSVVSRAGWPDARASRHTLADLDAASAVHAGRPTVVIVGIGAEPAVPAGALGTSDASPGHDPTHDVKIDPEQGSVQTPAT
jgi:uroporphyrin-III C-methyltransferase